MWWEGTLIEELIPNPDDVLALRSDESRVPLAFYGEVVPVPDRWTERPCGYVRRSAAYDEQLQRATALGWPIRSLDLSHLAPLTHPTHVADAIAEVLNELETR